MSYTTHANGDFLTRAGNYNVGKHNIDEEITLIRFIDASTDNLGNGLFYKLWSVPAGFTVTEAYVIAHTAEGAGDTIDIVDDDSATTTFVTNATLNSTSAVTATNARKRYAAAGYICMRPDADLTVCKFFVKIKGIITSTSM